MSPTVIRCGLGSRAALFAGLASITLIVVACNDITAPTREAPAPATLLINPLGTLVVTPDSLHGWAFYNDQQGVACGDTLMCRMVLGPKTPPAGTGSAELATNAAAEGNAMILADYGGTRFDQITDLRYSTYRQSTDAGQNLAIALQMNVDYDIDDQANGYHGRIVFEPYHGNGGNVRDTTWQSWDTRAGKWWGTRATVTANGVSRTNPCVQSSPCTWTTLLATFPNLGVHRTYGAVILKAGSGWTNFRGNVDLLTIAVNGTPTTFDFELHRPIAVGYRLRVVADAGVVFAQPMPRDTILPAGTTVPFSLSAAPDQGSLITVLDDTLTASSGTIVMNREHIFYAETEAPIIPSAAVTDIGQRVRSLIYSTTPEESLAGFINWFQTQSVFVGRDVLTAQLDTARYLSIDPVADSAAIRAFDTALNGTEFIFDSYGPVWYMKPEWYGYESEGNVASRVSATQNRMPAGSPASNRSLVRMRQLHPIARSSTETDTGEPDERTAVVYINGVFTLDAGEAGSTVATTTDLLRKLAIATPRFGVGNDLRENVSISYVYNRSIRQDVIDWKRAHRCQVEHVNELQIAKPFHALKRFALCTGIPFAMQVLFSDLAEGAAQFVQLQTGASGLDNVAVRKLLFNVKSRHDNAEHTLLVGHSQGNMIIAQAMQELPGFEHRSLNVGNGCTAALTFASPIASSTFPVDPQYLRGMSVEGDILLQMGLPNDFERIRTAAGDSVAALNGIKAKLLQGAVAHGVNENYLLDPNSSNRVKQRLTELSNECSGGLLTISPSALSMQVGDTARLDVVLTSRTGGLLKGRDFTGRSEGAFVSGADSTVVATRITTAPNEIDVALDNSAKVKAHMSVGVTKRRIITNITWTEEGMYWMPIAPGDDYAPGSDPEPCGSVFERFLAVCRFRYDITATSYDGKPLTYVSAMPLNHAAMGSPNRLGGGTGIPVGMVSQALIFESTVPAETQFEVRVTDSSGPEGRPVAVDTVSAQFDHRIPWPYASASLLEATFGVAVPVGPSMGASGRRMTVPTSPFAYLQQPATLAAIPVTRRQGGGAR